MFEKINKCPVCQHKEFDKHIICKDHLVTGTSFTIVKCKNCDFLFTNPRPDKKQLASYYKSDQYISHTDKSNNLLNTVYKIVRLFTLRRKEKLIHSLVHSKTLLDYGCGTGDFIKVCQDKKWEVYGYELDGEAALIAGNKTGIQIFNDLDQLNKLQSISIITLWHVLEHVVDLNETLKKLVDILDKNGKLLIAVPNPQSYDALYYGKTWAAYDVPRHLYHFTQDTFRKLMQNHGLKINRIIPMKLDSFYVSLLSQKYMTGKTNYLKSFINGCKSNIYAKKSNNYSSLIYIVSK